MRTLRARSVSSVRFRRNNVSTGVWQAFGSATHFHMENKTISAPSIQGQMNHKARAQTIKNMIKVWNRHDPQGVCDFLKGIQLIRKHQDNEKGLSREGTFMLHSVRSRQLDKMMFHVFGQFWDTDPDVMSAYNEVCGQFKINQQSMPNYRAFNRPTIRDGYQVKKSEIWDEVIREMLDRTA